MAVITYTWLRYVMAVEQVPDRDSALKLFAIQFPLYIGTIVLVVTYLRKPELLLDRDFNLQPAYSVFQIAVPCVYIAAILAYTMKRAFVEKNPIEL